MFCGFKNYFSDQSAAYAEFRPKYPEALYTWLASLTEAHQCVWDCATGNGQAAIALADIFDKVIATDASESQLKQAFRDKTNVTYRRAMAEASGLHDASVDLITVAQALHWFDFDGFFQEVQRVLKPGGVFVAWGYERFTVTPEVDEVIEQFYRVTLNGYWPEERKHVENGYSNIPCSLSPIEAPYLMMESTWSIEQLLGFLGSWSAVNLFIKQQGINPIDALRGKLQPLITTPVKVRWPLFFRAGRKAAT